MEKGAQNGQTTVGPPGGPPGPPGGWLFTRMSKKQEILFNIMVAMLQLIPQATLTTVFPVSKDIGESFSISNISVLPWVVAAYALSFGTFILVGGRLGDIFGHKTMVVIGYGWLSFWSIVAGLSHYAGYEVFFLAEGSKALVQASWFPMALPCSDELIHQARSRKSSLSLSLACVHQSEHTLVCFSVLCSPNTQTGGGVSTL